MLEGLGAIVGSAGVGAVSDAYCLDGAQPVAVVMPESEAEVCALMEYARRMDAPCVVAGGGTHLTYLAPPERAWWLLSTRRLNRIVDYSPHDLVLTVGAGMTLQQVQTLLGEHNQYLPWNVPLPADATLGGIVASNRAGSWRYRFGTPRDRLLAVRAVRTDGVAFKSGAKVVKSVAGYDLHRLLCGSWGTLAVLTEVTLKVQPLPSAFGAVGWFTAWHQLQPTLVDLMQMPLQPDGISVLALRGQVFRGFSGLRRVSQAEFESAAVTSLARGIKTALSAVGTPVRGRVEVLEPALRTALEGQPQPEATAHDTPTPYILLEFSGRPDGVAWQIQQVRERGYPAEPVDEAWLKQIRDWLAPRTHALLLQILTSPTTIAEAMAHWVELNGVSAIAHAGSGVLYIAVEQSGLTEALVQRIRLLSAKCRVLNGAAWLRQQTGGELPRMLLSEGERHLMQRVKAALDAQGILPALV
ncbi:MAG: FAD-binding oxidoreductase [Fimbriimonadales bacterium]|nr:FAD-binding oxidoreductase [Fimbriimonadales bacterium]